MNNLYLDIHVLQTVPANCINRDDTGSPKTLVYGGATRARVSSQAWKRAIRTGFREFMAPELVGIRTRSIASLIVQELQKMKPDLVDGEAKKLVDDALSVSGAKGDGKDVMFFISLPQARAFAKAIKDKAEGSINEKTFKAELEKALTESPSVDMILFGRMAASNPSLNYDAACQVAHAFSTHSVSNEYDYFTAVDDLATDSESGAGHLGTVEYNASTLYRYATINIRELAENLDGTLIPEVVSIFVDQFVKTMPTGKQNTFANRTLPEFIYVTIRNDQPINLAGAFEKPVIAGTEGNTEKSIDRLAAFADTIYSDYGMNPSKAWFVGRNSKLAGEKVTLPELLTEVQKAI